MSAEKCPFKIGDTVVYRPSQRGQDLDVMSNPEDKLQKGKSYKIAAIVKDNYVVVEGYKHPGGGLYWTEFSKA